MRERSFALDERTVTLPRGTRVVLRRDVTGPDGYIHRAASPAVVRAVTYDTYDVETPAGRRLELTRDLITVPRRQELERLGIEQWDHRRLRGHAIYTAVVGSRAWGLAGPGSDEDVRGCFVAPFEATSGLWRVPEEIHDASSDEALWEIGKLVRQGLRADANTLESLWSPLVRHQTALGRQLVEGRRMFVSMNVLGSFGRYAQSQFAKIERALARDRVLAALLDALDAGRVGDEAQAIRHLEAELGPRSEKAWREELNAARRSLFDRGLLDDGSYEALARAVAAGRRAELMPGPHRPKNAYNLLRLLHSCRRWLETGEPLIEVTGDLREVLLDIKAQRIPIERTLELARDASAAVEAAAEDARLPEAPDHAAADGLLRACRRAAASATFHVGEPPEAPPAPAPGAPFARRPLPARSRPTSTSTSSAASSSPTSTPARRWSPWPCPAPTPTASRPPTRTST